MQGDRMVDGDSGFINLHDHLSSQKGLAHNLSFWKAPWQEGRGGPRELRGVNVVYGRGDRRVAFGRKHIDHQGSLTKNRFPALTLRNLVPHW